MVFFRELASAVAVAVLFLGQANAHTTIGSNVDPNDGTHFQTRTDDDANVSKDAPRAPLVNCGSVPKDTTYDYIIVGAGAAGIPLADKLSEAGKSVLLLEKGPPSSGRWGGTMKPDWLTGTNLTRFDVPGLCNEIWLNATGVACTDSDQTNGCVLGGGTAINAGLWWKPHPLDWDNNFPDGWHSSDVQAATDRVFARIPGTSHPSMDGQLYKQEGFNLIANSLAADGWLQAEPNNEPAQKNHVFAHATYMSTNGERGGPMATYLMSAAQRNNFVLAMNAPVRRVVRTGGHATGVELECGDVVNITTNTGRVILSAGTFGTTKLLMRSGIGPTDQLLVIAEQSRDGKTMIDRQDWIDLFVGYNLNDHTNTDLVFTHPNVSFYDYYAAYNTPMASDKDAYLSHRTGILTQSAPNIGPMIWDQIVGPDGVTRQIQWTARAEGNPTVPGSNNNHSMTLSQYLGRGVSSRGQVNITRDLNTVVHNVPYLQNDYEYQAIIQGIKNVQKALAHIPQLTWLAPAAGQSVEDFVHSLPRTTSSRRANHWAGTATLGVEDGRKSGGNVVDADTRVFGTDNLFVVDASIIPAPMTANPSAMVVILAEHAAERLLKLPPLVPAAKGQQCGGSSWNGPFVCQSPLVCQFVSSTNSVCSDL